MYAPRVHIKLQYVRLDHETDVSKILGLFYLWDVRTPEVIFSVLSTDKSIETSSAKSDQNISTMICNSLVKAASSISAYTFFSSNLAVGIHIYIYIYRSNIM